MTYSGRKISTLSCWVSLSTAWFKLLSSFSWRQRTVSEGTLATDPFSPVVAGKTVWFLPKSSASSLPKCPLPNHSITVVEESFGEILIMKWQSLLSSCLDLESCHNFFPSREHQQMWHGNAWKKSTMHFCSTSALGGTRTPCPDSHRMIKNKR